MPAGYAEESTNHSVSLMNGVIYFFFLGFKPHLFYLGHRIEACIQTHTLPNVYIQSSTTEKPCV